MYGNLPDVHVLLALDYKRLLHQHQRPQVREHLDLPVLVSRSQGIVQDLTLHERPVPIHHLVEITRFVLQPERSILTERELHFTAAVLLVLVKAVFYLLEFLAK